MPGSCSPSNESVFRSVQAAEKECCNYAVHGDPLQDNQSPNDGTGRAIRAVPTKGVHGMGIGCATGIIALSLSTAAGQELRTVKDVR